MIRTLSLPALCLLLLGACKAGSDTGGLTPAHAILFGCDTFATTLDQLNVPATFKKLNDATVTIVTKAVDSVEPLCTGAPPNINATVKETAIDSGTRVLLSVLTNL